MGGIHSWVEFNWFNLIQTAGIMGSLWLTAAAAAREAKAREIENLLTIGQHHRELWSGAYQRPELQRIFQANSDALAIPPKVAEEEFLNLVIVQYQITWSIAKTGGLVTLKELAADMRGFFSLPLPHAVWEKTRDYRNQQFVRFVERALLGKQTISKERK
jgi:hypothetical protein